MDSLGNNRYQLLFIDDEASDVCVGQKKLQEFDDNPKLKCNKLPGSEKLKSLVLGKKTANQTKSSGKGEQGPKSDRSKATNGTFMINGGQKVELKKLNSEQQQQQPLQQQLNAQRQQQMQFQMQQPQQGQQQSQQPPLDPPQPQRHYRERTVLSRIISNSSKTGGYGYGRLYKSKFDRHSGSDKTGIKAVVKRNGGGAHNWGSVINDIEDQSIAIKSPMLTDKDDSLTEQQQKQRQQHQELSQQHQQQFQQLQSQSQQLQLQQLQQQGDNCMEEDDTKYITVEEWRAMRVERAKPIYNIRKAGEGEANKPDWKKMIVLPKKKPLKSDSDSGLEYDASMYPQRVGRQQRVMNIEFKFKDDRRRSGYLSGWVAGRSMAKCEVESVSDPINMNDEAEFPTLG